MTRWARRMAPRDPRETHRIATPLELLFDLCFVVAVAQASSRLHHGLAEGHFAEAVLGYCLVFFAIWWAWMNFTWFASAYDTDDAPYRLQVLAQIFGVLVLAAGVPRAFDQRDFAVVTLGYAIMRVGLVVGWLRAACADAAGRRTAIRYAIGVSACQLGWVGLLALPIGWWLIGWLVVAPAELVVPIWAERARATAWHPHHIAERYGLLTLVVLGESVLATTVAIQSAIDRADVTRPLVGMVVGAVLTLFSMWWIYFDEPVHRVLVSSRTAFLWGYGHFVAFASTAAVGAGLAATVDHVTGHSQLTTRAAGAVVAVPVVLYLLSVWAVQIRRLHRGEMRAAAFLITAVLVMAASSSWSVLLVGVLLSALVVISVLGTSAARTA